MIEEFLFSSLFHDWEAEITWPQVDLVWSALYVNLTSMITIGHSIQCFIDLFLKNLIGHLLHRMCGMTVQNMYKHSVTEFKINIQNDNRINLEIQRKKKGKISNYLINKQHIWKQSHKAFSKVENYISKMKLIISLYNLKNIMKSLFYYLLLCVYCLFDFVFQGRIPFCTLGCPWTSAIERALTCLAEIYQVCMQSARIKSMCHHLPTDLFPF